MIKTARKEFWRIAAWYDFADLVSDGIWCYYKIRQRYPAATDKPNIMRLFQRTFINHIHRLSNQRTAVAPELAVDDLAMTCGSIESPTEIEAVVSDAPEPVRKLLHAVLECPALLSRTHRRTNGRRETTNSWLCRMAGVDPAEFPNLHEMVLAHLRPA